MLILLTLQIKIFQKQAKIVLFLILCVLLCREGRLLQTPTLIGQEVQLSSSRPIRMSYQTNKNALIG